MNYFRIFAVVICAVLLSSAFNTATAQNHPNIIYILADDLG